MRRAAQREYGLGGERVQEGVEKKVEGGDAGERSGAQPPVGTKSGHPKAQSVDRLLAAPTHQRALVFPGVPVKLSI